MYEDNKKNNKNNEPPKHVSFSLDTLYEQSLSKKKNVTDRIQQYKNAQKEGQTEAPKQAIQTKPSIVAPEILFPSETVEERKKRERKERSQQRKEETNNSPAAQYAEQMLNNSSTPPDSSNLSEEDKARLQRQENRAKKIQHRHAQKVVFGANPDDRINRENARISTIIFELVCQLKMRDGIYHEDDMLDHLFDCTKELELNDPHVTFLPTEPTPEEGEDQLTTKEMLQLLTNSNTLYEKSIRKYIHFKDNNGLFDQNTGKVYLKLRLRLGKTLQQKTQARQYTRQIRDRWARKHRHEFKYSEVQQMNQYKIGFFSNISEGSNLIEIGNDFIKEVKKFIQVKITNADSEGNAAEVSVLRSLYSEDLKIVRSNLRGIDQEGNQFNAPVGWIIAGHTVANRKRSN